MNSPELSSENDNSGIEFDTSGVEFAGNVKDIQTIRDEQRELLAADLRENGEKSKAYILFMKEGVEVPEPKDPTFNDILDYEPNWQEDRLRLQQESIEQQYDNAAALSKSLRAAEKERGLSPTIYVLRGLSGSGKTYACKKGERFPGMLFDEEGEPVGTLAPDNSKKDLYKAGGTSDQIHKESSSMYRRLKRRIAREASTSEDGFSEIHDRVMDDPKDIQEVIENATETGRNIDVLDIDVPYVVSAVRVLQRPKDAPCPNFAYLEKTFDNTRMNRSQIIEMLQRADSERTPVNYSLLCYDYLSDPKQIQKEAARLSRNPETGKIELEVLDDVLYKQATEDVENEIDGVKNQIIDEQFIDWYCDTFFDKDEVSQELAEQTRQDLLSYAMRDQKITIYEALAEKNK